MGSAAPDMDAQELQRLRQQIQLAEAAEKNHTADMREMAVQVRLNRGMHRHLAKTRGRIPHLYPPYLQLSRLSEKQ